MDDFARLRQEIYLDSRGTEWDSVRDELSRLGRALLGDAVERSDIRNPLDAAALRRAGPAARVLELIPSAGSAPYLDRYIADAIASHPEIGADVDLLLAEQMARTENRTLLFKLAAAAGRHPFCQRPGAAGAGGRHARAPSCRPGLCRRRGADRVPGHCRRTGSEYGCTGGRRRSGR
jgi:hypothetical protein